MPPADLTPPAEPGRIRAIIFLMGLAQLVITSDFSIISVVLPTIGRQLGIAPTLLSWVVSANAVTFAGFLIVGGRLTDAIGHRRCLWWGLVVFGAGSLLSGFSLNIWTLIGTRALQGLGAAMISPASFSLINTFVPEGPPRHRALGLWGTMQGLSVILGLVLGGALTTTLGWRSVFFLNLPVVGVCLALTAAVLPRMPRGLAVSGLDDLGGAALITCSTGLLLLGLSMSAAHGLVSAPGGGALLLALAGFAAFLAIESRHASPLVPLDLLRSRALVGGCLAGMGLLGAVGAIFILTSRYLQLGLKFSAAMSGVGMVPIALATIIAGQCAPAAMRRWSLRSIAIAGLLLQITGLLLFALMAPAGDYLQSVAPFVFAATFGSTFAFMAIMGLAVSEVRADRQGTASAILFATQQIGLPLGVALAMAALAAGEVARGEFAAIGGGLAVAALLAALGLGVVLAMFRPGAAPVPA